MDVTSDSEFLKLLYLHLLRYVLRDACRFEIPAKSNQCNIYFNKEHPIMLPCNYEKKDMNTTGLTEQERKEV